MQVDSANRFFSSIFLLIASPALAADEPWIDFDLIDGQVFVESKIAGFPGMAMIDTGAELSAINKRFLAASALSFPRGRKVKILGAYGASYQNSYRGVAAELLWSEYVFDRLVEVSAGPPQYQLILGADFLEQQIFQIDYPNHRMRAISRDQTDLRQQNNVPSRKESLGRSPIAKVRLNNEVDAWLVVDTGYNGGVLIDRAIAKKQKWLDNYEGFDDHAFGINSNAQMQSFVLPEMSIGEFQLADPVVSVPAEGEQAEYFSLNSETGSRIKRRPRKAVGFIGYRILKNFVVTIDYKSGHIHLAAEEPGVRAGL